MVNWKTLFIWGMISSWDQIVGHSLINLAEYELKQ